MAKLKTYPVTDPAKMAAIGYCFGGGQVINMAEMSEGLVGVVSFHGSLAVMTPQKNMTKAEILVENGADDKFVPPVDVEKFKKQMDYVGAKYSVKIYPGATNAFTNHASTETGKKLKL